MFESACENEGCGRTVIDWGRSAPNLRAHRRRCDLATVAQREAAREAVRRGASERSAWALASVRGAR